MKYIKMQPFALNSNDFSNLGIYFIAGSFLSCFRLKDSLKMNFFMLFSFFILIISIKYNFFNLIDFLVFPILIIGFWQKSFPLINDIGDLSYGIYIYGFPIQQTLVYYFNLNYFQLMAYSLILSLIFAYFSWHLVEKKALKLKKKSPVLYIQKIISKWYLVCECNNPNQCQTL